MAASPHSVIPPLCVRQLTTAPACPSFNLPQTRREGLGTEVPSNLALVHEVARQQWHAVWEQEFISQITAHIAPRIEEACSTLRNLTKAMSIIHDQPRLKPHQSLDRLQQHFRNREQLKIDLKRLIDRRASWLRRLTHPSALAETYVTQIDQDARQPNRWWKELVVHIWGLPTVFNQALRSAPFEFQP